MMSRTSFGAVVAMTAMALAAPTDAVRELPFEIASNKPFVRVSVNGSAPQWFILDTGCSGTSVVAKECAGRIGLEGREETQTHLGAGEGVRVGVATSALFLVARGDSFQRVVILSVTQRTPAADAGLEPGDEILAIDGRRPPGLRLEEARRLLRTPGSRRLDVMRRGERMQVTLVTRRLV